MSILELNHQQSHVEEQEPKAYLNANLKGKFQLGFDTFRYIDSLGEGGFGQIHLVQKIAGGKVGMKYAMKVIEKRRLTSVDKARAELECHILESNNHPFVLKLWHHFNLVGEYVYMLSYCEGGDLFTRQQKLLKFPESDAIFYLGEILLALEYLHRKCIVHRDLKLENVLLQGDGHISLADFGLSMLQQPGSDELTDGHCGTVEFMAPEVILKQKYGSSVDVWAFGVIMFEMLTGRLPFEGSNEEEVKQSIVFYDLVRPMGLRDVAWRFIRKALSKNPSNRFKTANGSCGVGKMRNDSFFKDFNFKLALRKQLTPPFVPAVDAS